MRIAFHAPMKPPDHPLPSGDRTMGRLLMQALRAAGHEVFLASRLRTREPEGDPRAQNHIGSIARQEVTMLSARLLEDPPDLWFTYHLYYKAPDLIGPAICDVLDIPYAVAEASHAAKRMEGPHSEFARQALKAIERADAIFCMTERDRRGLDDIVPQSRLHDLKPFVRQRPRPSAKSSGKPIRLLTVAMMRPGDKMQSYGLLADALNHIRDRDWHLTIVGDGSMARLVRQAFASFGSRVTFSGMVPPSRLDRIYATHDLFLWPAVNEAYGLALLEASARGMPVIAGNEGGVSEVVRHRMNGILVKPRDAHAFARQTAQVLDDRNLFLRLQSESWRQVERHHQVSHAARNLDRVLKSLC
ncbi:glycosyltransferase family 4 protein [Minwuia sp.]|uniref:glycosyltransferase family 4 protein n=1 Tax=Minwuia sp. TaxID=2493630 RepID=UPI003A913639